MYSDLSRHLSYKCLKMSQDMLSSRCLDKPMKMSQDIFSSWDVLRCHKTSQDVSRHFKMSQDISRCLKTSQDTFTCLMSWDVVRHTRRLGKIQDVFKTSKTSQDISPHCQYSMCFLLQISMISMMHKNGY